MRVALLTLSIVLVSQSAMQMLTPNYNVVGSEYTGINPYSTPAPETAPSGQGDDSEKKPFLIQAADFTAVVQSLPVTNLFARLSLSHAVQTNVPTTTNLPSHRHVIFIFNYTDLIRRITASPNAP